MYLINKFDPVSNIPPGYEYGAGKSLNPAARIALIVIPAAPFPTTFLIPLIGLIVMIPVLIDRSSQRILGLLHAHTTCRNR